MSAFIPGSTPVFEDVNGEVFARSAMPDVVEVSTHLIDNPGPALTVRENVLDICCVNGRWVYEIMERTARATVLCQIRYREEPE